MLILLLLPFGLDARDFTYQGVNYTVLNEDQATCSTKAGNYGEAGSTVSGEISLPSVVYDGNKAYTLTEIADYSFFYCSNMTELEIPASVISIGESAFHSCNKLTHVKLPDGLTAISDYLFWACHNLQTIEIPFSVTSIGSQAFAMCSNIESIEIPSSVASISGGAFSSCESLTKIELPSSVTFIGSDAFSFCKKLQRIKLPERLTAISDGLFSYCDALQSVEIPSTVTTIGNSAFSYCESLSSVEFPSSVTTVGKDVFEFCNLSSLKLYCKLSDYSWLKDILNGWSVWVYCHYSELYKIKSVHPKAIAFTQPCAIDKTPCFYGVKFKLISPPGFQEQVDLNASNLTICLTDGYETTVPNTTFTNLELGKEYFIKDLEMGKTYEIQMTWTSEDGEERTYESFNTPTLSKNGIHCSLSETQTTVTINNIVVPSDETLSPSATSYRLKGICSWTPYEGDKVVFTDLTPNTKYTVEVLVEYGSYQLENEFSSKTHYILRYKDALKYENLSPSTVELIGDSDPGDAKIVERWWTVNDRDIPGYKMTVTGLKPDTEYNVSYNVKTDKGYVENRSIKFTTPSLSLEMLQPRGVSASSAIVAATTNISDQEPNVGFQWKKYDAPSSLKPNEGYAAIYDGTLEGNIKNLQTDKYYQVRAFYKDYWGDYHISDWVTFDPSDFSYFEPTVHTYPIENVGSDNATLRGYALPGSEDVVSQGFQYWIRPADHNAMSREVSAGDMQTIAASGQIMSVVIENLQPGTTYVFRAFAETASGFSYGEEQTFTTEEQTGIGNVYIDDNEPEIVGYYDISGRKSSEPQRGLNIVVYSDGTTRKMVLK